MKTCGEVIQRIWDAFTGKELHPLTGHNGAVFATAYSPDGKHVATAGEDGTVRIWDATTGAELREVCRPSLR